MNYNYKQLQQLVLTNLELLCEDYDNPKFWNNTTLKDYLKPELFLKPNKRAFNFITYFLITSLNLFESKKNIPWKMHDNDLKIEKSFYVFVREHVVKINKEHSYANIPTIQVSFMITGYGPQVIEFFFEFTNFVLFYRLNESNELIIVPPLTKDSKRKKNINQVLITQINTEKEILKLETMEMKRQIDNLKKEIKDINFKREQIIPEFTRLQNIKKTLLLNNTEETIDLNFILNEVEKINFNVDKVCNLGSIITETDSKEIQFYSSSWNDFLDKNEKCNLLQITKEANNILQQIVKIISTQNEISIEDPVLIHQKYVSNHEQYEKNIQNYIGNILILKKTLKEKVTEWQSEFNDEKKISRSIVSQETPKINFNIECNVHTSAEKSRFMRTILKDRSKMSSTVRSTTTKQRLPFSLKDHISKKE